jgi:hypothetical protein
MRALLSASSNSGSFCQRCTVARETPAPAQMYASPADRSTRQLLKRLARLDVNPRNGSSSQTRPAVAKPGGVVIVSLNPQEQQNQSGPETARSPTALLVFFRYFKTTWLTG